MSIIQERHSASCFERASIDEAYIDLTKQVDQLFHRMFDIVHLGVTQLIDVMKLKEDFNESCPSFLMDLLEHRPPLTPNDQPMKWTANWIRWLDGIDELLRRCGDDNTTVEKFGEVCDVVLGCESPIAALCGRNAIKSEISRRIDGTPAELKDATFEGGPSFAL